MSTDQHHLAGAYALNALTADERRTYEAHYPTCEICAGEVADYRATAGLLAEATSAAPPVNLRSRVIAEIATTRQMQPATVIALSKHRGRARRVTLLSAAAAAAVVVIAMISLWPGPGQLTVDDVIASPDAITTTLEGQAGAVTVVWSPQQDRVAIVGNDIPDPGTGRTYELWFVVADGVVPAGLFTPESGTIGTVLVVDDLAATGWGITNEPAGGSDQPTGIILYSGTI